MKRLGQFLFWGGLVVIMGYFLLSLLGRWGLSAEELYGWVKDFFVGSRVPIPLRVAIPSALLGLIFIILAKRKEVDRR